MRVGECMAAWVAVGGGECILWVSVGVEWLHVRVGERMGAWVVGWDPDATQTL